ncbi:DUF7382 domain-containing protein [Natrinema longum]|uniref:DUF7382 domain-containing protein n=1 Tax=Natrinema longum TaxID=370324 RepID=A0A8A2UAT8_9EURY|nr:hypothetical protein [Natrinema longum]MBZ6493609.1 hypothetical protein [Natrinema longum]QSW85048.1 hypothetical protein J0X27_16620 [Natrinema longum]
MGSKQRPIPTLSLSSPTRSFVDDDRAIEGLPIRLVIALIVGVMSLGIMLQMLGGIGDFGTKTEVDLEFQDENYISEGDTDSFTVKVVDENDEGVPEATVIATAGSARMDAVIGETGDDGEADFDFEDVELPPDADTGSIEFEIEPPTDSDWEDGEPNNELTVVTDG